MTDRSLVILSLAAVVLAVVSVIAFGLNFLDVAEDALEEESSQGGPREIGDDLFLPFWAGVAPSIGGLFSALVLGLAAPRDAPSIEAAKSASQAAEMPDLPAEAATTNEHTDVADGRNKTSWWTRSAIISGCISSVVSGK